MEIEKFLKACEQAGGNFMVRAWVDTEGLVHLRNSCGRYLYSDARKLQTGELAPCCTNVESVVIYSSQVEFEISLEAALATRERTLQELERFEEEKASDKLQAYQRVMKEHTRGYPNRHTIKVKGRNAELTLSYQVLHNTLGWDAQIGKRWGQAIETYLKAHRNVDSKPLERRMAKEAVKGLSKTHNAALDKAVRKTRKLAAKQLEKDGWYLIVHPATVQARPRALSRLYGGKDWVLVPAAVAAHIRGEMIQMPPDARLAETVYTLYREGGEYANLKKALKAARALEARS